MIFSPFFLADFN